jgi:hypothetical protein
MSSTLKKRDLKTATHGYLYSDGHVVLVHEKKVPGVPGATVQYATMHEAVTKARFKGRVVFHGGGALPLLLNAQEVEAYEPSITSGSKRTREMGLSVGSVVFRLDGHGKFDRLSIPLIPDVLSTEFTYQPQYDEAFAADTRHWSDMPVTECRSKQA